MMQLFTNEYFSGGIVELISCRMQLEWSCVYYDYERLFDILDVMLFLFWTFAL